MNPDDSLPITRRDFVRTLALPAGALLLGTAWAAEKEGPREGPSDPPLPSAAKIPCETQILWDFDGCISNRFMKRVSVYVHNGQVYLWVLLPELETMIVKVPLNGGEAQMFPLMPGHVTGNDPHRYYSIAVDSDGYVHVSGDMHSSPSVKHWISKRPEDISEFIDTSVLGDQHRPQGCNVTYPQFFKSPDGVLYHSIRCADPVWGLAISVLDVKSQSWTMLGAEVPAAEVHGPRAKNVKGKPLTAWEDNGEGGDYSYTQPHASICWDKNKRMHVSFALLNENTPTSSTNQHTHTHVLYACSDDGGKTFQRSDGSKIELPMRAEAGPHQAEVVYAEHEGPPPWLGVSAGVRIDSKNRPVVSCESYKTGPHKFTLENGQWTELAKNTPASAPTAQPQDDEADLDRSDGTQYDLPYAPPRVQYLPETEDFVYTVLPPQAHFRRILLVRGKPLAKAGGR